MRYFAHHNLEKAFIEVNKEIYNNYEYEHDSRIGKCLECINYSFDVDINCEEDLIFKNKKINRIDYKYANDFYEFMKSGSTNGLEYLKDYPQTHKFLEKPKSSTLPENFNTLYGPRIKQQYEAVIKELKNKPTSRRATILILDAQDQQLYDLDESIEYPCTVSMNYFIRDNKLSGHVHMRSQNVAVVMQLDMYLQGRLMLDISRDLGLEPGFLSFSMVSAHIYDRDFDYVKSFI